VSVDEVAPGEVGDWQLTSISGGSTASCEVDQVYGPLPFGLPIDG
jgi:hypothetical protein